MVFFMYNCLPELTNTAQTIVFQDKDACMVFRGKRDFLASRCEQFTIGREFNLRVNAITVIMLHGFNNYTRGG